MTAADVIRFAGTKQPETLYTQARGIPFRVEQAGTGLRYTIVNTQRARPEPLSALAKVVERYQQTKSLAPADYQDVTFNASYTLALLGSFLATRGRS